MNIKFTTNICELLEQEYLSSIKNLSLSELSATYGQPLNNLTDLLDLTDMLYDKGIKDLFQKDEFLNLPIMAHYSYDMEDSFIIGKGSPREECIPSYRAISIDRERNQCHLSFHALTPEYEVKDSEYKIVKDLLPLIKDMII